MPEVCLALCVCVCVCEGKMHSREWVWKSVCACTYTCVCEQGVGHTKSLGRRVATVTFPQPSAGKQNREFTGSFFAAGIAKEPKLICQLPMTQLFKILTFKIDSISSLLSAPDLS